MTQPCESSRSGAKGDQRTTYEFLPERPEDSATLEDFPEKSELLGTLILDLDEDQMFDVIDGKFTLQEERSSSRSNSRRGASPAPRRGSGRESSQGRTAERTPSVSRRTPPTRGRGF